jgi:hypothetical protein
LEKLGIIIDTTQETIDKFNVANGFFVKNTRDSHFWKNIWLVPAGIATLVLILFFALFREPKRKD